MIRVCALFSSVCSHMNDQVFERFLIWLKQEEGDIFNLLYFTDWLEINFRCKNSGLKLWFSCEGTEGSFSPQLFAKTLKSLMDKETMTFTDSFSSSVSKNLWLKNKSAAKRVRDSSEAWLSKLPQTCCREQNVKLRRHELTQKTHLLY